MASLATRFFCDRMRHYVKRELTNVSSYHEMSRLIFRRGISQRKRTVNYLIDQPKLFMSHKTANVSFDDPSIQKYVSEILQERHSSKSREGGKFALDQLLKQREQLLTDMKAVSDLMDAGDKEDKELKSLAEAEYISYQSELKDLDDQLFKIIVPRNIHENYSDIIVEISSGAGGQEAMLFAGELLQLYENYANLKGWECFIDSIESSDIGGIKSVSMMIHGQDAYYYMQHEIGVHRVQRVPVTSSAGMIHTSTAAVIVMPQPTEVDIKISEKDIEVEAMRASGPGGQNINKSESAIRIRHLPTGLVVECKEEKTQHRNRNRALIKLRTKLYDIESQKISSQQDTNRRQQLGNRERSAKIRTYNFPQNRITDHRAHVTAHSIREFMEGRSAFQVFHEKLAEQYENELLLQFVSNIKQKYTL